MAWSVLQHPAATTNNGATTTLTNVWGSNLTAGSVLLVGVSWTPIAGTMAVTDNAAGGSNTYTKLLSASDGNNLNVALFSAPLTHGAGTAPTVTATDNTSAGIAMAMVEVAGIQNVVDVSHTNNGTVGTTTPTTGATAVTTAGNEFCIAVYGNDGFNNTTITAAWTADGHNNPSGTEEIAIEHQDSGSSGSAITGTWTNSGSNVYGAIVAVFKLAASASGVVFVPSRMPLGV